MSNQKQVISLIRAISGQANILTIPRVYIALTKSHRAALLLSQCVYWSDKTTDNDGWFYKSAKEWRSELGMPKGAVDTALKVLPWIETRIKKANGAPTRWYRVRLEALADAVSDLLETRKSDLPETRKLICAKTENDPLDIKLHTETTKGRAKRPPAHPAITAFREVAHAYPSKAQWPAIIETVGDDPDNISLWRSVVGGYILLGWNPRNVAGMLDYYRRREVPQTKRPGAVQPSKSDNIAEALRILGVENGD